MSTPRPPQADGAAAADSAAADSAAGDEVTSEPPRPLLVLFGRDALTIMGLSMLALQAVTVGLLALLGWLSWTSFLLISGLGWLLSGLLTSYMAIAVNEVRRPRVLFIPPWLIGWTMLLVQLWRWWGVWGLLVLGLFTGWAIAGIFLVLARVSRTHVAALARVRAAAQLADGSHESAELAQQLQRSYVRGGFFDLWSQAACRHNIEVLQLVLQHRDGLLDQQERNAVRDVIARFERGVRDRTAISTYGPTVQCVAALLDSLPRRRPESAADAAGADRG